MRPTSRSLILIAPTNVLDGVCNVVVLISVRRSKLFPKITKIAVRTFRIRISVINVCVISVIADGSFRNVQSDCCDVLIIISAIDYLIA